ncbi:MAG: hypothetical protein H7833_15950 [Magnetococcus sp. DMHC-1]|nr:hypothetical protein [Magnetococcales bacterium]
MRIYLFIVLALLVLGALIHGCVLLWRGFVPGSAMAGQPVPESWFQGRFGLWLLAMILCLLVLLGIDHVLEVPHEPPRNYEPPHMENGQIVPGRFN